MSSQLPKTKETTELMELRRLEEEALRLPREDRRVLAERLASSLDSADTHEVPEASLRAAESRYLEFKANPEVGIPADRALDEIRQELGWVD